MRPDKNTWSEIAIQSERMSLQGCRSHSEVYAGLERRLLDRVLPAAAGRKAARRLDDRICHIAHRLGCAEKGL